MKKWLKLVLALLAGAIVGAIPSTMDSMVWEYYVLGRTFVTAPEAIQEVTETFGDTWAYLDWEPTVGATHYSVRYDTSDYPSDNLTGTEGYFGSETSCNITGLSEIQVYNFSVFAVAILEEGSSLNANISLSKIEKSSNGWHILTEIYYDPLEDEPTNEYLAESSVELQEYLGLLGKSLSINTTTPPDVGIILSVNSSLELFSDMGNEAFSIETDFDGIRIIGKTPLAVRHGTYALLEELGFRWYFKNPIWKYTPDTLAAYDSIDIIDEPDFAWRGFQMPPVSATFNIQDTKDWAKFNRMWGEGEYQNAHSYINIYPPATYYASDPSSFVGSIPDYPWQLNPYSENVINAAITYARTELDESSHSLLYGDDNLPYIAVSISPQDGWGWEPPYDESQAGSQNITNAVWNLVKEVAENITGDYPDSYISLYCYSWYTRIPEDDVPSNIIVFITTTYNYGGLTLQQQIDGMVAKGVGVGIYDYLDVWTWWHDAPYIHPERLEKLADYYEDGVRYVHFEGYDSWGPHGTDYWLMTRYSWDSSSNTTTEIQDFCDRCFGNASDTMNAFFANMGGISSESVGDEFERLEQAELEAIDDEEALSRIRYMQYYYRFLWKYHVEGIDVLNQSDLEEFYTFITKIRDMSIVSFIPIEAEIREELQDRFPETYPDAASVYVLADYDNNPTTEESITYMTEAKSYFGYGS